MASVTLGGNPVTVNGTLPRKGDTVSDFTLTGNWHNVGILFPFSSSLDLTHITSVTLNVDAKAGTNLTLSGTKKV